MHYRMHVICIWAFMCALGETVFLQTTILEFQKQQQEEYTFISLEVDKILFKLK